MASAISKKPVSTNPLKLSQPLGAALAFLGLDEAMPCFHGAKGCTSFGLVTFVKHFRESIPFQSTAMEELTTILGGHDNLEQAILNMRAKTGAKVIGICSTGLTEIRGEDIYGDLRLIRARNPEIRDLPVVVVSTPDFAGSFQDGWSKAVTSMIEELVPRGGSRAKGEPKKRQINILAGSHLTAADLEELREMVEAFGMTAVILPDISGSLDGHMPDEFKPITLGGTTLDEISSMGRSSVTVAIGEHMRGPAEALEKRTGVTAHVLDRLTGLEATDRLMVILSQASGRPVPPKVRRQRSQLVDALLDGHFYFGGVKVGIAAEPDLLFAYAAWLGEMGAKVTAAVTTSHSAALDKLPVEVVQGDLGEFQALTGDCAILFGNSHATHAADAHGLPLFRIGIPVHDRLGPQHHLSIGYRGTRDLIFKVANALIAVAHEPRPDDWPVSESFHDHQKVAVG